MRAGFDGLARQPLTARGYQAASSALPAWERSAKPLRVGSEASVPGRSCNFDAATLPVDAERAHRSEEGRLGDTRCTIRPLLILALPLTPATRHLLNAETLAKAQPWLRIVNAGRGSVADEAAVADALSGGRIGGYAADVFEMEDLGPRRSPAKHRAEGFYPIMTGLYLRLISVPVSLRCVAKSRQRRLATCWLSFRAKSRRTR